MRWWNSGREPRAPGAIDLPPGEDRPQRDISFDYLRATITLMVVAHHSALAYKVTNPNLGGAPLEAPIPVIDPAHWLLFNYAANFNDVYFMSLMFFVSGLFVWPSLRRGGVAAFLSRRAVRLGVPFVLFAVAVMPLAYYASPQISNHNSDYLRYWGRFLTVGGWPSGPLWFVWLLLLFDTLAAGAYLFLPARARGDGMIGWSKSRPVAFAALMLLLSAGVYLPALQQFGFGRWTAFIVQPLWFQTARFGLYLLWFASGVLAGAVGVERGFLARDGAMARNWWWWVVACIAAYNLLEAFPRARVLHAGLTAWQAGAIESVLWIVSCTASCFAFLALFRGRVFRRRQWMDSLARTAYVIYLVHYVFVLWTQRALLGWDMVAEVKFALTFAAALVLSWCTAQVLLVTPGLRRIL